MGATRPPLGRDEPAHSGIGTQHPIIEGVAFNLQLKYPDLESDVVLASGTEARLIEAEAAYRAGSPGQALTILNVLRALEGLTPLTDPVPRCPVTMLIIWA